MCEHLDLTATGRWWVTTNAFWARSNVRFSLYVDLEARSLRFRSRHAPLELHDLTVDLGSDCLLSIRLDHWPAPKWVRAGVVKSIDRYDHLDSVIEGLVPIAAEYDLSRDDVLHWLHRPTTYYREPALRPVDHLNQPEELAWLARDTWGAQWY